jgi:tagatose-1,6-bisphosphate aldolase
MTTTQQKSKNSLFSKSEQKVIKVLGRKKMTITDLVKGFYRSKRPVDANNKIGTYVRRIQKKCKFHDLPWTLEGIGAGRNGRTVWRERV